MKARLFHATVVFLLTFVFSTLSAYAQEEDILIEPPLTWSINSIQIVWSVSQGATQTQEDRLDYGDNQVKNKTFSKEHNTENAKTVSVTIAGGTKVNANAGLDFSPLKGFGLLGANVNATAYVEGGFNYNQTDRTSDTSQWSESEKNVVSQALTSAFEQNTQQVISNQRLVFTVDFVNHSSTRLFFSPNSSNTIPVYCGKIHIGDAHLISENATIAATGKPIPCQFEMALNDTGKQSLVNNRPIIRFDGGQLLIQSNPNVREPIEDAIQESTVSTGYFTIAILSGNEVKEWKIRWFRNNPVTLLEALEAVNENVRDLSNDDNKTVFVIEDNHFINVCGAPFTDNEDPDWITKLKVFKGANSQTVTNPDSCLSESPRRGERYVFELVSQEIKKLEAKANAGDSEAIYKLAVKYFYGNGVPEDKNKAIELYRKSADQGNAEAQNALGECYAKGDGILENKAEAVKWYRKAAEQGLAEAQYNFGKCYLDDTFASSSDIKKFPVPLRVKSGLKWIRKAAEQGNLNAQKDLGNFIFFLCSSKPQDNLEEVGTSIASVFFDLPLDKAEAVKWIRKAAEQGDSESQDKLGDCYYNGDGIPKDYSEAVKWYRKAAEQGNYYAQLKLGDCYFKGDGVLQDKTEAEKWYCKVAENGFMTQYGLGNRFYEGYNAPQDFSEAVKWFHKAAEQGDSNAQYKLGICYYYGKGVPQDNVEAIKWWRKAAKYEGSWDQCELGSRFYNGNGVPQDYSEAVKWFRKAIVQGNIDAQYNLGICYYYGTGVPKNEAEGLKWIRQSAEQDNASAQCFLGNYYYYGKGFIFRTGQNKPEAIKWYRKAAEQGNSAAQLNLGDCYFEDYGNTQNKPEAIKWYRKAAEQGNCEAQLKLGDCYYKGNGVLQNKSEAVRWYRKAAEQRKYEAQLKLGDCYYKGDGVPQDKAEAEKWYRKVAEWGAWAQNDLGDRFLKGEDVPQDKAKAVKWYRKAAEQNHTNSQLKLGDCYFNGDGVPQDKAEAIKWYRKAAKCGNKDAIEVLKRLNITQ